MSAAGWAWLGIEAAKLVLDVVRAATSGDKDAITRARRNMLEAARARAAKKAAKK